MITEEQAREAAERLRAAAVAFKDCEDDDPRLTEIEWAIEGNEQMLVTFAREELSRRDAERAERALPITAEWLESMGFEFNGLRLRRLLSIGHYELSASPNADDMLLMQDDDAIAVPHVTTRGQLLDLLNALKGGAT